MINPDLFYIDSWLEVNRDEVCFGLCVCKMHVRSFFLSEYSLCTLARNTSSVHVCLLSACRLDAVELCGPATNICQCQSVSRRPDVSVSSRLSHLNTLWTSQKIWLTAKSTEVEITKTLSRSQIGGCFIYHISNLSAADRGKTSACHYCCWF